MSGLIQPNKQYAYTDKGNRIYQPNDADIYLRNLHVALNGDVIWDVIAICPKEGWIDVLEHEDGNNFNRDSKPKETASGKVVKRLYGKVELGEVTVQHHN